MSMSFISYQIKMLAPQRFMIKSISTSDCSWSTIFCVIVYLCSMLNRIRPSLLSVLFDPGRGGGVVGGSQAQITKSSVTQHSVTEMKFKISNYSYHAIYTALKTGLTLKKLIFISRIVLCNPNLTCPVNFSNFQLEEMFSFSKFF